MKERPIIFSTESVRAILEGRKTQTRRVIKPQPEQSPNCKIDIRWGFRYFNKEHLDEMNRFCPYGQVGEGLWVRETWALRNDGKQVIHKAGYEDIVRALDLQEFAKEQGLPMPNIKWRSAFFMPRWASRITLEITEVRVERLQEISEEDVMAEGEPYMPLPKEGLLSFGYTKPYKYTREHFAYAWDPLNTKRGYGWETNPWVWVILFATGARLK